MSYGVLNATLVMERSTVQSCLAAPFFPTKSGFSEHPAKWRLAGTMQEHAKECGDSGTFLTRGILFRSRWSGDQID
jgi:hypothetical protein